MTSFTTITPEEYKKLVDNERKIFDLTENFTTPEILNKYRHSDKNIDDKIKKDEKIKEKYERLDKIINKNIDKIKEKSVKNITNNYFANDNDEDDKYISYINENVDGVLDISDLYEQQYKFDNDENILNSFSKIYEKHNIKYEPRDDTKFIRVRYLLKKLKDNDDIDTSLYNHFHTSVSENNKLYHKIPTYQKEEQTGSSVNIIIINDKDLNNGILRIKYLNNRKLTTNLLKHDYKISKKMVNAIKFNKDILNYQKRK